jgi:hypothetical protein
MTENSAMLKVFTEAELHARRKWADGLIELAFDLPGDVADPSWGPYLDAVAERESHADAASLRHIFAAESVAVVGASRRPESVGRAILHQPGHQRLRRAGVCGQPARQRTRGCPVPALAGCAARTGRRRGGGGPAPGRAGRGRGMRETGRQNTGGDHLGAGPGGQDEPAHLLPPPRDAADRPELLRHCRAGHRPGRYVRRSAPGGGEGWPGRAVGRAGHRAVRAAVAARHRHLLVCLPW